MSVGLFLIATVHGVLNINHLWNLKQGHKKYIKKENIDCFCLFNTVVSPAQL